MRAALEQLDDLALKGRVLRGDREAAAVLFQRHIEPLYAFVHYRVGGDRAAAEDVVQDTFLTALEGLAGFDGRSSLSTWLAGIARNKIRSQRRQRRPMALEDALADADPQIDAILADVAREPLPEEVLDRRETRELVGATLSSLPDDYRAALLDKYVEGKSVEELATAGGTTFKAAESRLQRARVAFARVFELLARRRGGLG